MEPKGEYDQPIIELPLPVEGSFANVVQKYAEQGSNYIIDAFDRMSLENQDLLIYVTDKFEKSNKPLVSAMYAFTYYEILSESALQQGVPMVVASKGVIEKYENDFERQMQEQDETVFYEGLKKLVEEEDRLTNEERKKSDEFDQFWFMIDSDRMEAAKLGRDGLIEFGMTIHPLYATREILYRQQEENRARASRK